MSIDIREQISDDDPVDPRQKWHIPGHPQFDSGRPMRGRACVSHLLPVFVGDSPPHLGAPFPILIESILAKDRLTLFHVPCNSSIWFRKRRTHMSLQSHRHLSFSSNQHTCSLRLWLSRFPRRLVTSSSTSWVGSITTCHCSLTICNVRYIMDRLPTP